MNLKFIELQKRMHDFFRDSLRNTFIYDWIHNYKSKKDEKESNRIIQNFNAEAVEILNVLSNALNSSGIHFWLDYGTLLGYYREKDFIKYDSDLDIGAFVKDAQKIREVLLKNGFELCREFNVVNKEGKEDCFIYKNTTIDFFYYMRTDNECYGYSFEGFYPFSRMKLHKQYPMKVIKVCNPFKGVERVRFKGAEVSVPINAKEWLIWNYGENFMTPDSKFDYKTEAKNVTLFSYDDLKGVGIIHKRN